jgi:hypothetical protein
VFLLITEFLHMGSYIIFYFVVIACLWCVQNLCEFKCKYCWLIYSMYVILNCSYWLVIYLEAVSPNTDFWNKINWIELNQYRHIYVRWLMRCNFLLHILHNILWLCRIHVCFVILSRHSRLKLICRCLYVILCKWSNVTLHFK